MEVFNKGIRLRPWFKYTLGITVGGFSFALIILAIIFIEI